jgi:hypothetical protein
VAKWPLGPLSGARSAGRLALWGMVALGVTIILGVVVYRVFFQGQELKRELGNAVVAEEQAQGSVRAGQVANEQLVQRYETHRIIERRVEEGVANVQAANDSDFYRVLIDALCMHDSYRLSNPCPGVQQAGPPGPEEADSQRAGAGG